MYTLRVVFENDVVCNYYLGNQYTLVPASNKKQFETVAEFIEDSLSSLEESYGIVYSEDNGRTIPLFIQHKYYIMTEGGKTFEKLLPEAEWVEQ